MSDPKISSRLTTVDHLYETCDRTCASLYIYPDTLTHQDVTTVLGIEPTTSGNAGEAKQTCRGPMTRPRTFWGISSEDFVVSKDVRAHLDWLLDLIEPAAVGLDQLQSRGDVIMAVRCAWWSRGGHGGPTLWPEQMLRLAQLNLECSFDVQFYPDDDTDTLNSFVDIGTPD